VEIFNLKEAIISEKNLICFRRFMYQGFFGERGTKLGFINVGHKSDV
jgi:hypothetical protein